VCVKTRITFSDLVLVISKIFAMCGESILLMAVRFFFLLEFPEIFWDRDGVVDIVTRVSQTTANWSSSHVMDKEFSSLRPNGLCGHTATCAVGTGVFPAGQVAGT
jgi:hypothetical protein